MTDGGARQVGFVGVGTMGNPMAANLLAAGHRLTVHDVRAAQVDAQLGVAPEGGEGGDRRQRPLPQLEPRA